MYAKSRQNQFTPRLAFHQSTLLPILVIVLLSGCFTKTGPLEDKTKRTFSYKEIGFSLSLPQGWLVTPELGVLFTAEFRRKDIPLVRLALLTEETIPFLVDYLRISKKEKFAKRMLHFSKGELSHIDLRASKHYKLGDKTWIEIVWSGKRDGIAKVFHSLLIPTDNAIVQLHFEFSAQFYNAPDNMIRPVLKGIMINAAPKPSPEDLALTYRTLGTIYKNQGLFKEAIKFFNLALSEQPEDVELYVLLGSTYFQQKSYQAALKIFLKVTTEMTSQNTEAYRGLGKTYFEMGRYDEGISAIKHALSLSNQEAPLYLLIGNAYLKQNKIEEAVQTFQNLLKEKQLETEGHLGIGKAYLKMELYEQAIFEFEQVLEKQPRHKEPHCLLEKAYFEIGESEKAEAEKVFCKKEGPETPEKP